MFGIISSLLSGGITGILGSLFTNILNYFTQKQRDKQQIELRKLDLEAKDKDMAYMIKESELGLKTREVEVEGSIKVEEAKAFTESQRSALTPLFKETFMERLIKSGTWYNIVIAGIISFLFGIVDFLKHIMRPGITIFVSIVYAFIIYKAWGILEVNGYIWNLDDAVKIIMICVDTAVYLVGMIYGWHFSDRQVANFMSKNLGMKDSSIR